MNNKSLIYSAVYGIVRKGNKVLFIRRCNTGYKDGLFTLPSGHIDEGELPSEAMIRELKEEVGLIVSRTAILPVHTMYRIADSGRTYIDYYFEIKNYKGEALNKEPEKCSQLAWLEFKEDSSELINGVKIALSLTAKGVAISEVREDA